MKKTLTCIDCPKGCSLVIDIDKGRVVTVEGFSCKKGEQYAREEIENPMRILTSTVYAETLAVKMVPVRTDKAIPKERLHEAMDYIRAVRVMHPVQAGDVIDDNFLGLDVKLIATRTVQARGEQNDSR